MNHKKEKLLNQLQKYKQVIIPTSQKGNHSIILKKLKIFQKITFILAFNI